MKKIVLIVLVVVAMLSSCTVSRGRYGCPDTWNMVGYR